jgi:hypothetical protein
VDQELNELKASVNLVEYAAGQGYWVDKAKSSKRTTVMRHDNDDKIVIYHQTKYWWYFSARDARDKGTIIDFIQNRQGLNLGQVKSRLRDWLGHPQPERVDRKYKDLNAGKRDVQAVQRYIQSTKPISDTEYLESRHIGPDTIFGPRFDGTIKQDRRGNTVFLHRNCQGLCGAELKNHGFTGCPKDSVKGVWHSNLKADDNRLILCEAGIDNLSYHILHGKDRDRHISTAGNFSAEQQKIVKLAIEKMPSGSHIVAAFDNDNQGEKYAQTIAGMVPDDKQYHRHSPVNKDWNDDLKTMYESNKRQSFTQRPSMMRV